MFTDVYNSGKHFKPFSSSLFRCVMGSGNKAHFDQCLTVLGTVNSGFYGPILAYKSILAFEQARKRTKYQNHWKPSIHRLLLLKGKDRYASFDLALGITETFYAKVVEARFPLR